MLKNLLAAIGAVFLCKKSAVLYQKNTALKEENELFKTQFKAKHE